MPYDYLAPSNPFGNLPQDTPAARAQRAQGLGYKLGSNAAGQGGQAISYVQGQGNQQVPVYTSLSSGAFSPSLLDQAGAALKYDVTSEQGAANRQYERNAGASGGYLEAAGNEATGILGESNFESSLLSGFGNELKGYGNQAVNAADRSARTVEGSASSMENYAQQATGLAAQGISTAGAAIGAFNADVHSKIDSMVAGIDRRSQSQLAMIESGVQADGQPLSAAERWQMHRELSFDTGQQVAAATSQAWDQARNALAGLKMNMASLQEQAAGTALGAGELTKEAGQMRLEGAQTRMQAENIRQNYAGIRSQMMNLLVSGRASARAMAAQMRVNGMGTFADMIYRNPESVVSLFAGLAQMAAISTAPGGRTAPGVNFG